MPPARGTFGSYVVINPGDLQRLLQGPNGPVARDLLRRGNRVKQQAQKLVGVHRPHPQDRPRARKPGTLRDSIVVRLARGGPWGVSAIVGSEDRIALWHHEGTVPHRIVPRRRGGFLVFYWPRAGRVVFSRGVNHPGTQPNRFLTNALPAAR